MSQTAYAIDLPAVSYPGQPADIGVKDVLSAVSAAAIKYGLLVVRDTSISADFSKLGAKLPAASADVTTPGRALGVVLADQARAQDPSVVGAQYPIGAALPCARIGRVCVSSESAVVDGSPVYVRFANGDGGTQKGSFSGVLDVSVVGNAALPGAVWRGATSAAGFACVEFNLV